MRIHRSLWRGALSVSLFASGALAQAPNVDITWDKFGVPHIDAQSDSGAFFGAGYTHAKLRLFQMYRSRLAYEGRLAEFFGPGPDGDGNDLYVGSDRAARLHGLRRMACRVVQDLAANDAEVYGLLCAYAEGVNAYIQEVVDSQTLGFHPGFAAVQLDPDQMRWTPEDSVGVWWVGPRGLGVGGLEEANELRRVRCFQSPGVALPPSQQQGNIVGRSICDGDAAAALEEHVDPAAKAAMQAYADGANPFGDVLDDEANCTLDPPPSPPCSEVWAFRGDDVNTGATILVAEPRLPNFIPNVALEWHMRGASFEVRGAGVPGSPNILWGSTRYNAWGNSGMGLDQSDLFRIEVNEDDDQYMLDGTWTDFTCVETEEILVAGGAAVPVAYRETVFGPDVSAIVQWKSAPNLCPTLGRDQNQTRYALRSVLGNPERNSLKAFVRMYRAAPPGAFRVFGQSLEDYVQPGINMVYTSSNGRIGYWSTGDLPVRRADDDGPVGGPGNAWVPYLAPGETSPTLVDIRPMAGWVAQDGRFSENDWAEILPHGLMPFVEGPKTGGVDGFTGWEGFLYSANQTVVDGAWYPIPNRPGGSGDGFRARQLRERLQTLPRGQAGNVKRRDVVAIRNDAKQNVLAEFIVLADTIDQGIGGLSADAQSALALLLPWAATGADFDPSQHTEPGVLLGYLMPTDFRKKVLTDVYGGGQPGYLLWLDDALDRAACIPTGLGQDDVDYVDWALSAAWRRVHCLAGSCAPTVQLPTGSTVSCTDADVWYFCTAKNQVTLPGFPSDGLAGCGGLLPDPNTWYDYYKDCVLRLRFPEGVDWFNNGTTNLRLGQNSLSYLGTALDVNLVNRYIPSIWCQHGQVYAQVVEFDDNGDPVLPLSILPPGNAEPFSELAAHAYDQVDSLEADWLGGGLKPSPLFEETGTALAGALPTDFTEASQSLTYDGSCSIPNDCVDCTE